MEDLVPFGLLRLSTHQKKTKTLWGLAPRTKLNLDFTTPTSLPLHREVVRGFRSRQWTCWPRGKKNRESIEKNVCYLRLCHNNYSPANIVNSICTLPASREGSTYLPDVLESELGKLSIPVGVSGVIRNPYRMQPFCFARKSPYFSNHSRDLCICV